MSLLCAVVCALSTPITVKAVGEELTTEIMISEISPESKTSASQEAVVLYNPGAQAVDVTGWQLQYRSASHMLTDEKGWSIKAIIGCAETATALCQDEQQKSVEIAPGKTVRLTTNPEDDDFLLVSGMATTGGQVRLVRLGQDSSGPQDVQDFVGYGTAKAFEGLSAAIAPKAGQSIIRIEAEGRPQDTNDNAKDFNLTPSDDDALPPDSGTDAANPETTYLAPVITEVFPDPASPQTDSNDEFVEFYNPYDEAIDLDGYMLVTGANWTRTYTIQDVTLAPGEYVALAASATNISLSNSGTGIRLLDPKGGLLVEVPSYGKAATGSSWVQGGDGQWTWTSQPTPGAPNVIVEPPAKAVATTAAKKASTPKAESSTAAKSSTKKAATSTTKTAKTAAKAPGAGAGTNAQPERMNYMILAIAAAAAGGYVLFEYRRDIATYSRAAWQQVKGAFARK